MIEGQMGSQPLNGATDRARDFASYVRQAARRAGYDVDSPRGGGRTALARDTGMSQSSVGRVLAGKSMLDPAYFEPLASALRVPVSELLVLSGLVSRSAFSKQPQHEAPTPRQAAMDLGITDPLKVELFEMMVRALLVEQNNPQAKEAQDG